MLAKRINRWARRRHGVQESPVTLLSNRIYILPSRSGIVFATMLLVMLLGSMNYNNSMGLGLAFLLGSIALVAMHTCHRNLLGLTVNYAPPEPVFAGANALVKLQLGNDLNYTRSDLVLHIDKSASLAVNLESRSSRAVNVSTPTTTRGHHALARLSVRTRFPAGLFRAWTWVYWDAKVLVYPAPAGSQSLPEKGLGYDAGTSLRAQGEEELAELRDYQRGDPLNRVAWKQFARSGELHSKTFDSPASAELWLDFNQVTSQSTEERLSQLCAWIELAHEKRLSYGLRLPDITVNPDNGPAHRARCLKELALY